MSAPRIRLFHYWRSSSSWRVRWAFSLKKIAAEMVAVNLLDDETEGPEHLARNPLGYVPVVEFLDAPARSPERYLAESVAIIEWADERFPSPALLPGTPEQRAHARRLVELVNANTQPFQNPTVTDFHSGDKARQKEWASHFIRRGLGAYEQLARETARAFTLGDEVTMPDLFLIPQVYAALRFDIPVEKEFPGLWGIYSRALEMPSCQSAHPDRFKPAP